MNFEECLDDAVKFGDTQRTCFTKGYEAGQQSRQKEIDVLQNDLIKAAEGQMKLFEHNNELQKRIVDALNMLDSLQEQHWKKWKEGADMMDQGASNAYEHSYWILKGDTK